MKSIITITLLILGWASAGAQIFVKLDATGANDGTSWANAFTNLQSALDSAAAGSQVWIAAGNYIPQGSTPQESHFWVLKPVKLYGGFAGNETSLAERNWEVNKTILNGDKNGDDVASNFVAKRTDNAHHVMIIDAPDGESVIDGLIFQGGSTRTDTYAPDATDNYINRWAGGAIYVIKSPVTVRNSVFRQNNSNRGSGIFVTGNPPEEIPTLVENCLFEKNNAVHRGAGAYVFIAQSATIHQCKFYQNKAVEGAGVAIGNASGNIIDCDFNLNSGNFGAAMVLFQNTLGNLPHANFNVLNSKFTNNTALSSGGGFALIALERGFSIWVDSCLFENNKCTNIYGSSGALSIADQADVYSSELATDVHISNTIIRNGEAAFSGGIGISAYDDSMNVKMNNVKILNNKGFRTGGGLYIDVSDLALLDVEIKNSVFDSNSTDVWTGAAIQLDIYENKYPPGILIDSCIFSNNEAAGAGGAYFTADYGLLHGPNIIMRNSHFFKNSAVGPGGALFLTKGNTLIENATFSENYTYALDNPYLNGGGAICLRNSKLELKNSILENNISEIEGAAIFTTDGSKSEIENVLFLDNLANNTIYSRDTVSLRNATMIGNIVALGLDTNSHTTIQNSIFSSVANNLLVYGPSLIYSKGSNISSDNSMSDYINGYGAYDDMHNTDPKLNVDFVPEIGSPAIDAANPEGVTSLMDLAGNPRWQGGAIDIGSFESFLTVVKDAVWNDPAISVYPNPVSETLNLKLESSWLGETKISIYNQLGQQVYSALKNKDGNTEQFEENVLSMAQGQYVLLVKAGRQTYASTIMIQR